VVLSVVWLAVVVLGACSPAAAPDASTASAVAAASPPVAEATTAATPSPEPTSSPTPEPTPAPIDPCSLVTRDEANTLAGVKVGDPMPAGDPPTHCTWPTPTSGAVGQTEVEVGDGAKKAYDIDNTVLHHAFTPVDGLADEAYQEDRAIFFRKGDVWVEISVVRLDSPTRLPAMLRQLADTVAGRLP
jgi:hypothetical protein